MTPQPEAWFSLLRGQIARYPLMQPQDLYKLLHQAALGSEHAVRDAQAARDWLARELASLLPGPLDPLCDPLSPDGRILRLHLRPFLAQGGDPQTLLEAFIQTANQFHGSPQDLRLGWAAALQLARDGQLPFSPALLAEFFTPLEEQGFPALHHSLAYAQAYHPAYRVVAREYAGVWLKS